MAYAKNTNTVYHEGGFLVDHPSGNKAEEWSGTDGLYSRWDTAGTLIESRPLTPEEDESLTVEI